MRPEDIERARPVIEEFTADVFGGFARRDQRAKGELYVRGLLLDGRRKSMQPMADRLGVDHQQLQQFVTTSTWDHGRVRRRVAVRAQEFVAPDAWVVDDTAFPKDGHASPGVARMYCDAWGRTANCQVGVSVHAAADRASAAVDWRLFLPRSWDDHTTDDREHAERIRARRGRCAIPDDQRHREKWLLALDMLDEVVEGWGLPSLPVVADAGYGDAPEFRQGLTDRGLAYVLAVTPTATAAGTPRLPEVDLTTLVVAAGRSTGRFATLRRGVPEGVENPTGRTRSRFLALRVCPTSRTGERLPECWLLAEWPTGAAEPTGYWLSTLPADTALRDLVRLAAVRCRIDHDYRELKDDLGLDHFEGRSWLGWHRHVTLASVAQAIRTTLRHTPPRT